MIVVQFITLIVIWLLWAIACAWALCFAMVAVWLQKIAAAIAPKNWQQWDGNIPIARQQKAQPEKQRVSLMLDPDSINSVVGKTKLSPLVDRLLRNHLKRD
jgi:predicted membrane metal-binding protein